MRNKENAQQIKEHKLKQQKSLNKNLEQSKYLNGDHRMQLERHREHLSTTNRQVGQIRLEDKRSSDGLRGFDKDLKKGLIVVRTNNELQRKIEAMFLISYRMEEERKNVLQKCFEQVKVWETKRNEIKKTFETLRQDVRAEEMKAMEYSDKMTTVRSELSVLEQDLSKAEQMEASTKMHADSLANDVTAEKQRYEKELQTIQNEIDTNKQAKLEDEKQALGAQAALEKVRQEMEGLKAQMVQVQKEEGHSPEDPFDLSLISSSLTKEEQTLVIAKSTKEELSASVLSLKDNETKLQERENILRDQLATLSSKSTETRAAEKERRQALEKQVEELETAKKELARLHQSHSELSESRVNQRNLAAEQASALQHEIEEKRQDLSKLASELGAMNATVKAFKEDLKQSKETNDAKVSKLNRLQDEAQSKLNDAKGMMVASEATDEEYKAAKEEQESAVQKTISANASINAMIQGKYETDDIFDNYHAAHCFSWALFSNQYFTDTTPPYNVP